MNKLVVTMAAGLYIAAPTPAPSALVENLSGRIAAVFAADPVPVRPVVVSVNGSSPSRAGTATPERLAPLTRGCTRTMTLSLSKMASTAFTDECVAAQGSQSGYGSVVKVGYSSST